ncbi:MAG: 4-alpha-glucanotransferase [Prevotella sp.]
MRLIFNVEYETSFGEELMLNILSEPIDGALEPRQYHMSTVDGLHWTCRVDNYYNAEYPSLDYFYSVANTEGEIRREWTAAPHRLEFSSRDTRTYVQNDRWTDIPCDVYLYSSAFTSCINRRPHASVPRSAFDSTLRLEVHAPQLRSGDRLALIGNHHALGSWNLASTIAMTEHKCNCWMVDLDATLFADEDIEFKFVILNDRDNHKAMWETGLNRKLHVPSAEASTTETYSLTQAFFEICDVKLAGTLVPVFSLRSESSFGVGDFGDLKKMVGWVADTRQRVLQLLPVNDTTTTHTRADPYPYSCISVFALHPQYVDLSALPPLADETLRRHYESLRRELNALPQLDYERVNKAKNEYLRLLFEQEGTNVLRSAPYKRFFKESEYWLVPYARYCCLRDTYGTADFTLWPDNRRWDESRRARLSNPRSKGWKELSFYFYVQYILARQLGEAHDYAVARGVILKGDIPIGVNRKGCDVWQESEYFNLDAQAGAPPDAFAVNGQNWEFPTYNWERMLADGCRWWVRRFRHMSLFFDAYRIDHVLGFFRIWEIPADAVHALTGHFAPALGMTAAEIESYGLFFREQLFTQPFITTATVEDIFGDLAPDVMDTYLDHSHSDVWHLKPEYDTQRKIEAAFADTLSEDDKRLRDGLYALVSEVLFVRDHRDGAKFHPRITAHTTHVYQSLDDKARDAFCRLYDDYFYHRNNYFWYREAMKKLPLLVQATRMLVCAEDLGMVPDCVAWVMEQLRILSLELQSMPKRYGLRFGRLGDNPYRSVCTISTHDTPTLRQWWDEDTERTADYYSTMLYYSGDAPHPLPGWLASDIIARHLESPSMLCILSIQDWLAIDETLRLPDADAERINIPADPHHYWRYRMHLNIEQLAAATYYNNSVRELISRSGR